MWTARALAAACLLVGAACSGAENYGSLPPAAPSAASAGASSAGEPSAASPPHSAVEVDVLAQYTRFWAEALPAAAAAPANRRVAVLAPVTTEPELSHVVRSLAVLEANGQTNYGADVPVQQVVRVDGSLALVEGCLDSSRSGVAEASTGAPVTRGVPRNPVRANLVRGTDGRWRVSAVTYPRGATC
ncbi:hypothetical protein [Cryptosporangium minutisporangium]|uniref:Lipoprotein n=1 Tax=Cryptosporangium minutisporangium TaxID=113569 RepID=A0ABP6SVX6_9ACTN